MLASHVALRWAHHVQLPMHCNCPSTLIIKHLQASWVVLVHVVHALATKAVAEVGLAGFWWRQQHMTDVSKITPMHVARNSGDDGRGSAENAMIHKEGMHGLYMKNT